jgi:hypothetical protein
MVVGLFNNDFQCRNLNNFQMRVYCERPNGQDGQGIAHWILNHSGIFL